MLGACSDFPPPFGSIVLDCDSTLCAIEGIDELAHLVRPQDASVAERIAALTDSAMNGAMKLEQVYGQRLELLKPTRAALDSLAKLYVSQLLPHASELVRALQALDKRVHIVSGGILQPLEYLATHLGLQPTCVHAVEVFLDRAGNYAGFDSDSPLCRSQGKLELVRQIARHDRSGGVAMVGDGASDLEAAPATRRFVAFAGVKRRPAVVEKAHVVCSSSDLAALAPLLLAPHEIELLRDQRGHAVLLAAASQAQQRAS